MTNHAIQCVDDIVFNALRRDRSLIRASSSTLRLHRLKSRLQHAAILLASVESYKIRGSFVAWQTAGSTNVSCKPLLQEQIVGRSGDCEIILDSLEVSRRHASISVKGHAVTITDLGSVNGTLVNGEFVHIKRIHSGDIIRICDVVLMVATVPEQIVP